MRRTGFPAILDTTHKAVALAGDNLLAAGWRNSGASGAPNDAFVLKLGAAGGILWRKDIANGSGVAARVLAPLPDGRLAVVGDANMDRYYGSSGGSNVLLMTLDGSGVVDLNPASGLSIADNDLVASSAALTRTTTTATATTPTVTATDTSAAVVDVAGLRETFSGPTGSPAAPTAISASGAGAGAIGFQWADSSPDETGFAVLVSVNGGPYYRYTTASANATSATFGKLISGATYSFRVAAFNEQKYSALSAALSVVAP